MLVVIIIWRRAENCPHLKQCQIRPRRGIRRHRVKHAEPGRKFKSFFF